MSYTHIVQQKHLQALQSKYMYIYIWTDIYA